MESIISIIGFIAFIIGLVCSIEGEIMNRENELQVGQLSLALGVILLIFMVFGSIKVEKQPWTYHKQPYAVEKIVSLNDNNMMNGRVCLRRGYIESDLYYQYIVYIGNGGYKANKVRSDNTTLHYSDGNYRVEWCKKTKKWLCFEREETYNKIYIPEGSITDDFAVDLN